MRRRSKATDFPYLWPLHLYGYLPSPVPLRQCRAVHLCMHVLDPGSHNDSTSLTLCCVLFSAQ